MWTICSLSNTRNSYKNLLNIYIIVLYFTLSVTQELPKEIGQLSGLSSLNISHNPYLSNVPDEIGKLSRLWEVSNEFYNTIFRYIVCNDPLDIDVDPRYQNKNNSFYTSHVSVESP